MIHPMPIAWIAENQQEKVRRDVARSRAVNARTGWPPAGRARSFREKMALRLGAALIATGRRLQAPYAAHYEPAVGSQTGAYRSGC